MSLRRPRPVALEVEPSPTEAGGSRYQGPLGLSSRPAPALEDEPSLRERWADLAGGVFDRSVGRRGRTEVVRSRDCAAAGLGGEEVATETRPRDGAAERTHAWGHVEGGRRVAANASRPASRARPRPPCGTPSSTGSGFLGSRVVGPGAVVRWALGFLVSSDAIHAGPGAGLA